MTIGNGEGRALVLTVGTGNIDNLEETLIEPMLKSIGDGEWRQVVLLPSRVSETWAKDLSERVRDTGVKICPLPKAGAENDADACFDHFDRVLGELVECGFAPDRIVPDFTRGTKAMSAAFVLAAVRRGLPVLRYVHSERRDNRGMVVPGTEIVGKFQTGLVSARRRLDLAADLVRHGDFGAVPTLVPDSNGPFAGLWPEDLRNEAAGLRAAAGLYAAWDRLDYRDADELMARLSGSAAKAPREFRPSDDMRAFLKQLAPAPAPKRADMKPYAAWLRAVACDLLANAERRVRDRQFEDALLRSYRILELVGQFRLFDKGYDSGAIDPKDERVCELRKKLRKKKYEDFGRAPRNEKLTAPRMVAARLLRHLGDSLGERLVKFDSKGLSIAASGRNHSILIHGFEARAPSGRELNTLLERLQDLLLCDDAGAKQRLETARRLDFRSAR